MFDDLYRAGFRDIIPIIPPGASISPRSRVARDARGKAPGKRGRDGWGSFDWMRQAEPTETERETWASWGASVGLRTARFPAVDIDVLDGKVAEAVSDLALRKLGPAPARVGRAPKTLLLYRLADEQPPMPRRRLWFDLPGLDKPGLVELLGSGQQCVVDGVHATTGKPYEWAPTHIAETGVADLTPITPDQIDVFYDELEQLLDILGAENIAAEHTSSIAEDRVGIDQNNLVGPSVETVVEAVKTVPNDNAVAPTRNDYLLTGYAIKASLRDDPEEALEAWTEWAMRWPGNEQSPEGNDLETVLSDWSRMKPPFSVGWNYLAGLAQEHGMYIEPTEFAGSVLTAKGDASTVSSGLSYLPARHRMAPFAPLPPPRPWVLGNRFLRGAVTVTVGQPGVGKSAMSILTGLSIALGLELTGEQVHESGRVWVHNNEDDADEMRRRIYGVCKLHGIPTDERLQDRFIFTTSDGADGGAGVPLRLAEKLNEKIRQTGAVDELVAEVRALGIVWLSIDPFVSIHSGVDENSNAEIERVADILRAIARQSGASVDIPHHSVKSHTGNSESRAGDMNAARGAGALIGAVRSAFTLSKMSETTAQDLEIPDEEWPHYVRLDPAKGNYAPAEARPRWFRFDSVPLDNGGDTVGVPRFVPNGLGDFERAKASRSEDSASAQRISVMRSAARILHDSGETMPLTDLSRAVAKALAISRESAADVLRDAFPPGEGVSLSNVEGSEEPVEVWAFPAPARGGKGLRFSTL